MKTRSPQPARASDQLYSPQYSSEIKQLQVIFSHYLSYQPTRRAIKASRGLIINAEIIKSSDPSCGNVPQTCKGIKCVDKTFKNPLKGELSEHIEGEISKLYVEM